METFSRLHSPREKGKYFCNQLDVKAFFFSIWFSMCQLVPNTLLAWTLNTIQNQHLTFESRSLSIGSMCKLLADSNLTACNNTGERFWKERFVKRGPQFLYPPLDAKGFEVKEPKPGLIDITCWLSSSSNTSESFLSASAAGPVGTSLTKSN